MSATTDMMKQQISGRVFTITKSDTVAVFPPPLKILVGVAGDLVVKTASGDVVTMKVPVGVVPTPGITHVMAATTATDLVGINE